MELQAIYVQILALVIFAIGLIVAVSRRNVFFVLMGVELALNAVNLSFVGFAKTLPADASIVGRWFRCSPSRSPLPKLASALPWSSSFSATVTALTPTRILT